MRIVREHRSARRTAGRVAAALVFGGAIVMVALPGSAAPGGVPGRPDDPGADPGRPPFTPNSHPVGCASAPAGFAHCNSRTGDRSDTDPRPAFSETTPYGLSPQQISNAYQFQGHVTSTSGSGTTVAIVGAFHMATAESDLAHFSSEYHLPVCNTAPDVCTFTQVGQSGRAGGTTSRADQSWGIEANLDTQWAHALAPGANILLVEADSNDMTNLMTAVQYAAAHAQYVSMSWSMFETSSQLQFDGNFTTPGVSYFASSGDNGTPAEYPSASPNVISVGGTTLKNIDTTPTETGWSGSGGGCSYFEAATAAQAAWPTYAQVSCKGKRATPDVSLDADPASGVSVYNTGYQAGLSGWYRVGGTSASAPMWAGRAASEGGAWDAARIYSGAPQTFDITSGNNGASAKIGYDLVTGRGSWFDGTLPASQQPPVASFSTTCTANTCTFKSTSTGSNLKYLWTGDNKVSGTSSSVKHTYPSTAQPVTYGVTLKASNAYGAQSVTHTVTCAIVTGTGTKATCTLDPEPPPPTS